MAEEENAEPIRPEFRIGRIRKIMKLDKDIDRVNTEALFLVACSTELFLRFIAEKSAEIAMDKKRKIVKLDHLRAAVKRHQPTSDFLLDLLPVSHQPSDRPATDRSRTCVAAEKSAPAGTRRIDDFFRKPESEAAKHINDS